MTHNYVLLETLKENAIRLRYPECGRQAVSPGPNGVVYYTKLRTGGEQLRNVEVAGDTITPHRYGVADNAKVEER